MQPSPVKNVIGYIQTQEEEKRRMFSTHLEMTFSAQLNISEEILSCNYRINGWQALCNILMGVSIIEMTEAPIVNKTRSILFSHVCGQLANIKPKEKNVISQFFLNRIRNFQIPRIDI